MSNGAAPRRDRDPNEETLDWLPRRDWDLGEFYETLDSLLCDLIILSLPDSPVSVRAQCVQKLLETGGPMGPKNPANRPWQRLAAWNDPHFHFMGKAYPTWTDAAIALVNRMAVGLSTVLGARKPLSEEVSDPLSEASDWVRRELLTQQPPIEDIRVYIERERERTLALLQAEAAQAEAAAMGSGKASRTQSAPAQAQLEPTSARPKRPARP
ncbi:MAG: hypothetical protein GYA33_13140 [Thermogutta sp.]|nr:hypothetical protein [Thermogutta sp.]